MIELVILYFYKNGDGEYIKSTGHSVSAYFQENGTWQFVIPIYIRGIFRSGLISYLLISSTLLLQEFRKSPHECSLISRDKFLDRYPLLIMNMASWSTLMMVFFFFQNPSELLNSPHSWKSVIYALSPILWVIYLYSVCELLIPVKKIWHLLVHAPRSNHIFNSILLVSSLLFFYPIFGMFFTNFWSSLLLSSTIELASAISRLFDLNYHVLPDLINGVPAFGTNQFEVEIYSGCSGYEGMTLIVVLLALYCNLNKTNLRIDRSWLMIPAAGLMMFMLNGLRIFLLVAIGHYWSPQVAIEGFHLVGGWLNLFIVFFASILALNYVPFFQKYPRVSKAIFLRERVRY